MNKILTIFLFFGFYLLTKAQNISLEESTYGIQVGAFGGWAHNETKLSNSIALRTEFGFDSQTWGGNLYKGTGFLLAPVITLEPRYYYNLKKRVKKSRHIEGNSGNFISIKTSYHPDWFLISNKDNISIISDVSIVPTWGIRRNIGPHFTYEVGIGIGYKYIFAKQAGYSENESETSGNLHLRVGYRF